MLAFVQNSSSLDQCNTQLPADLILSHCFAGRPYVRMSHGSSAIHFDCRNETKDGNTRISVQFQRMYSK